MAVAIKHMRDDFDVLDEIMSKKSPDVAKQLSDAVDKIKEKLKKDDLEKAMEIKLDAWVLLQQAKKLFEECKTEITRWLVNMRSKELS